MDNEFNELSTYNEHLVAEHDDAMWLLLDAMDSLQNDTDKGRYSLSLIIERFLRACGRLP